MINRPALIFRYVKHQSRPQYLLEFLTQRFPYHDRHAWNERISAGLVQLNDSPARPEQLLNTGDRICYQRPDHSAEPQVDRHYSVLYEDQAVVVVNKSGNMPSAPSGAYWHNCLVHILQNDRNEPELRAVHRLDRETSGVNVFARNKRCAALLGKAFAENKVDKTYLVVLWGVLKSKVTVINCPVQKVSDGLVRIRQHTHTAGRPCETVFYAGPVLTDGHGRKATLTTVRLIRAGRTHQIRVHAQLLGHHVVGDKLYGQSDQAFLDWLADPQRWNAPRHLLHAQSVRFINPISKCWTVVEHNGAANLVSLFMQGLY